MFTLTPTTLRRRCWLALFAMLAAVLFPTVSHALAAQRGTVVWTEICTPQGMRQVALPAESSADPSRSPAPAAVQLEHCAFCLLQHGSLDLPPLGLQILAPVVLVSVAPSSSRQAPALRDAGCHAQARAPPIHS
ncbi:MAG: DUF2946 domain-containing protein [Rhizobacter sp.]